MMRWFNTAWWVACGVLVCSADVAAQRGDRMPSGALPIDPCVQGALQVWSSVQLATRAEAADRDGLLFAATLASPLNAQGSFGGYPSAESISVEVAAAAGTLAPGSVALSIATGRPVFAWRPAAPLAANTQYVVKVSMKNAAPPTCSQPASLEQRFAITTIAELSAAPPSPPLRAIAYGEAWSMTDMTCCEPRDASACGGSERCAKCWSARREPTIVPLWDPMPASTDPLEIALYYGSLDALDPNTVIGFGFGTSLPNLAFRPLAVPKAMFPEGQSEVCMTGALRNFRTGSLTLQARCTEVTPGAGGLIGIAPPKNAMFEPPADASLLVGPAECLTAVAPYERGDVQVAASFHTHRDTCLPGCAALLPVEPPQLTAGAGGTNPGNAGSSAPPTQNLGGDTPSARNADAGCHVGAPTDAPGAFLLWMAFWIACRARSRW